jgi:alpha-mannosidase/mannosylglycerate hydrolase
MTASPLRDVLVFSHTHWDREWYRPFEAFRYRLVEVVDAVMDLVESGRYGSFLLDGQTIVLDDYLEIRPEQRDRLHGLIRGGKLSVGPWYILPDEALVSGESLIRNLAIGQRMAKAAGRQGDVGYLPDMFGHVAQMPAILKSFGLDRALVWRGVNPSRADFRWLAPDGSDVLALHLPLGYYNTAFIEHDTAAVTKQLGDLGPKHAGAVIIPDGGDHLAPGADLADFLAELDATVAGYRFRQVALSEALATLPATSDDRPEAVGELRGHGAWLAHILPGVLSTRPYLKQANHQLELLLTHWTEPLAVWASLLGAPYPAAFLDHAWKLLLQNQPHDSICGCSVDAVHREMMPRFERATAVCDTIIERSLAVLGAAAAPPDGGVVVVNPLPTPFAGPVTVAVDWASGTAPAHVSLTAAGQAVPMWADVAAETRRFISDIRELPRWEDVTRRQVTFWAEVPAFGTQALTLSPAAPVPVAAPLQTGPDWIDNGTLRLTTADGGLTLTLAASGQTWANALVLTDEGDAGDTYNYSPPQADEHLTAQLVTSTVRRLNPWQAELVLQYDWTLPLRLQEDRQGRSDERAAMPVTVRLLTTVGSAAIAVHVTADHRIADHRWRLVWRMPAATGAWSGTPFGCVARPLPASQPAIDVPKGTERAEPTFPVHHWAAITDARGGMAIVTGGLAEGEVLSAEEGHGLAITLMRAVGWLSRDDLRTRGGGAGPALPTPEAQCAGPYTANLWFLPFAGDWQTAGIPQTVQQLQVGVRTWQGRGQGRVVDLSLDWPAELVFSSLQQHEGALLVRGGTATGAAAAVTIGWTGRSGEAVRPDGTAWPQAPAAAAIHTVRLDGCVL